MCGICGTTRAGDGGVLDAMNRTMVHRGPDDAGIHVDAAAGVGLGARRLSIVDLETGHQPIGNEDGRVWAVLNGELYNHAILREHLRERGHRFASRTDTEVLVHLYEEYGCDLVHAVEGMFAFAIWDAARRRLVVARDRFGEKPLFYAERHGHLTFASELTALRAAGSCSDELDPAAVDHFFTFGYVAGPRTILRDARQLPPAHRLVWDQSRRVAQVDPYWRPPDRAAERVEPLADLVAETHRLLDGAVRSRLLADVPVGVFLSGGVDSTLVTALAAQASSRPIRTFTVSYDTGGVSEAAPARAVAALVGAEHHEVVLTSGDVGIRLPSLLARLDQPLADQALVASHAVAELARREVVVAVGGEGADEIFGGYPRYRWLDRAAQLHARLPPTVAASASAMVRRFRGRRALRLADVLAPTSAFDRHVAWVAGGRPSRRADLYGPALQGSPIAADDLPDRSPAGAAMRLDQARWLPDDVLAKADRAGMLVSLEVRTPYLERRLVELAASIPADLHLRGGGKYLLRAVLERVLPEARRRRKMAFRVPAAEWLRGPLAPLLRRQLDRGALYRERWFDRNAVAALVTEHTGGRHDRTDALWPLLALGLWLDRLRGVDEDHACPPVHSGLSPGARGHPAADPAPRPALAS